MSNFAEIQARFDLQTNKTGLAQLVRFSVMELTHSDLNLRFNISVTFMTNYSFSPVVDDVPVDKTLFVIDFVNFKIKPT
jgi:hypothetical protein